MELSLDSDSGCGSKAEDIQQSPTVVIAVRHCTFTMRREQLDEFPNTRLGALTEDDPNFNPTTGRYEFDRNPMSGFMDHLVDFYRDGGDLHLPPDLCHGLAHKEMAFWGIEPELLAPCCYDMYEQQEESSRRLQEMEVIFKPPLEHITELALKRAQCDGKSKKKASVGCLHNEDIKDGRAKNTELEKSKLGTRDKAWAFFHDSHSSPFALAWSLGLGFLIYISVGITGLETLPQFRNWRNNQTFFDEYENMTANRALWLHTYTQPVIGVFIIDAITAAILIIDLCGLFFSTREKVLLLKCFVFPLQVVITIALIIVLSRQLQPNSIIEFQEHMAILLPLGAALKTVKVLLLIRLARTYRLLYILLMCIQKSWREMILLIIVMTLGMMVFSIAMYYAELYVGTFDSMLDSYWWALVTMTTVGYGDYTPKTHAGRMIGSVCVICGVIVIAIPVAVIGGNFAQYYATLSKLARLEKRKQLLNQCTHRRKSRYSPTV